MTHFFERCADWYCFLAVDKEGSNFGFSGGGHDVAKDVACSVDGAVVGRWLNRRFLWISRFVAEVEVASSATACFGFGEVRRVAVDVQYHVAGGISNGGMGIGVGIVEEPHGFVVCFVRSLGLCGCDGAKGD